MTVRRIVTNVATPDPAALARFYETLLDLRIVMNQGWIVTLAGRGLAPPQLSLASEGGSGQPVPDLSIEVDDLEPVLVRMASAGIAPVYGPIDEPWGVRRLFLRDPAGRLLNILTHMTGQEG